jgi:NADH-quinone oxidoreductase E subunit
MLSEAAVARIQELCKEYPATNQKSALVPALYVAQRDNGGHLTRESLREVADELDLPESHVYAVATFYSMFYHKPVGHNLVQVCTTSPCGLRGAAQITECFKKRLGIDLNETTADGKFTLMEVECLAACHEAPMAQINEDYYLQLDEKKVDEIVSYLERGAKPPYAEFPQDWRNAHPITLTDAELAIDVSGITPAPPVEKKPKPEETAAPVA